MSNTLFKKRLDNIGLHRNADKIEIIYSGVTMVEGLSHITFIVKDLDRNRIKGEGISLYFYDYDNHLFELHTGTLAQRLEAYK